MTRKDDDAFERLSKMAVPDPDPAKIDATVAASSRAFSQRASAPSPISNRPSWLSGWFSKTRWALPALATGFALVVMIALVPLVNRLETASTDPTLSRAPQAVADAELNLAPMDEAGTRMGAMPSPTQQLPLDMREDVEFERFVFGELELGLRSAPEQVAMYLLEGNVERQFDLRMKEPSETITISDGFIYQPSGEPQVLLVRSGYSDAGQNWDAFVETAQGYSLSGALTLLVNDAESREEVVARLEDDS